MSDQVSWILQLAVKDGRLEELRTLMDEMVESTRGEPGALGYQWFVSGDGTAVHIYERYADDAATIAHLGTFGEKFAARFLDVVQPTGFTVYGSPGDDVRKVLDGFGASYLGDLGGFAH
jgi:quinol monooxygenase YgiN